MLRGVPRHHEIRTNHFKEYGRKNITNLGLRSVQSSASFRSELLKKSLGCNSSNSMMPASVADDHEVTVRSASSGTLTKTKKLFDSPVPPRFCKISERGSKRVLTTANFEGERIAKQVVSQVTWTMH